MFIKEVKEIVKPSIKDDNAIENIRKAAKIAQDSINLAFKLCMSGVRASKVDKEVEKYIKSQNAYPANFEVPDYGFATSISSGNEIAHGRPTNNKILVHGEPVCVDVGVKYNGYYADCARTIVIEGGMGSVNHRAYKLIEACKKASLHDFIMSLPNGYDTNVGELGDTLSGGEKQRIGIARSFLHKAPFILLDEPTSNLDSLNEAVILKSIKDNSENRTVVLVSHRLSTLNIADKVYKMKTDRVS